jgi:hypothetical protein
VVKMDGPTEKVVAAYLTAGDDDVGLKAEQTISAAATRR